MVRGSEVEAEPKSEHFTLRRNRVWPIFAVVLAILGGAVAIVYWVKSRPDPYKVLVAIEVRGNWWEGSKPAAVLADDIGTGLKRFGFEPVQSGDPEVEKLLSKNPIEAAASKLHAGFLVTGSLEPRVLEHEIDGQKLFEVTTSGQIQVRYGTDTRAPSHVFQVESSGFGATADDAVAMLVQRASSSIFDQLMPKLMGHPKIESLLKDGDIDAVTRLKGARSFMATRDRRLKDVRTKYDKITQNRATPAEGSRPIHFDGTFNQDDELIALGPDLSGAAHRSLVAEAPVDPYLDFAEMDLAWSYGLEKLAWRSNGTAGDILWQGYHLVHVTASAQGNLLALVDDLYGRGRGLVAVDIDGKQTRLRLDAKARYDNLELSADGALLAFYDRACADCRAEISVLSTKTGDSRYRRPRSKDYPVDDPRGPAREDYYGLDWLDDHQLLLLVHDNRPAAPQHGEDEGDPPDDNDQIELRIIDFASDPPLERLITQIDRADECSGPSASPDASRVVMTCKSLLTFFDTKTGEVTKTPEVGLGARWAPNGKAIVYTRHGDVFLMHVGAPLQQVERLTQNDAPETNAQFSSDGQRVYFESQANDPNVEGRIASVIGWVELP